MGMKCKRMKLSAVAFGVSLGIITGLTMLFFALGAWHWEYGTSMMATYTSVFPGYEASLKGCFIGLAWGFLYGFITGVIWAWIYNLCNCGARCCCCCGTCKKPEGSESSKQCH